MGQKVHPIGFRLGVNQDWRSRWYADKKKFSEWLLEDLKIKEYVKKRFPDAEISKVTIERAADKIIVTVHTARPGVVIGRRGSEVEALRQELIKLTGGKAVGVNVAEVPKPEIDAQLVAENIARRIEMRASHRRVMKRAVENAMRMGAKGIKVQCKGRLGGAEIARKEWYLKGRVPLQTIRSDIDYGFATAFTKWGTIGVKVWIYKGEKMRRELPETLEG